MQDPAGEGRLPAETGLVVLLCTCPDETVATEIATMLVAGGLAACVNRIPGVRSLYCWQGQVQEDDEVLLLVKTTAAQAGPAESAIRSRHPYEMPEVVALPVSGGSAPYLDWVRQNARGRPVGTPRT